MNELSDQTKALLARYRQTPALEDGAKQALWARVGASVADEEEAVAGPTNVVPIDRWRSAGRIAVGLAAVAAVLLLIRTVAHSSWVQEAEHAPSSEQAVYGKADQGKPAGKAVERKATRRPSSPAATTVEAPVPSPEPATTHEATPTPERAPQPRTTPRPATESQPAAVPTEITPPHDSLAEEMRLMTAARRALAEGQATRALALLEQHARDHAAGQMAEDRAALKSRALCAAGRNTAARKAATAFLAGHPRSAHGARVQATLELATKENCPAR